MDAKPTGRTTELLILVLKGLGLFLFAATAIVLGLIVLQAFGYNNQLVKCNGTRTYKDGRSDKNSRIEMTYTGYTRITKIWERGVGTLDVRGVDPYGFFELTGKNEKLSLIRPSFQSGPPMAGSYSLTTGDIDARFVDGIHGNDSHYVGKCNSEPL